MNWPPGLRRLPWHAARYMINVAQPGEHRFRNDLSASFLGSLSKRAVPYASRLLRDPACHREILHTEVTRHPTANWAAQQIVECCARDRAPPRFLIHDRDGRYGAGFDRRVRHLGIRHVRAPFRSPRNGLAERLIGSIRRDCLDHVVIFGEQHLRHLLNSYQEYYNKSRTHLSLKKDAPIPRDAQSVGRVLALPILGGLHHRYVRV
jgi:Integrase core domain